MNHRLLSVMAVLLWMMAVWAAPQPWHILVTGRGPGEGAVEELWRPLRDQFGWRTSVVYTVHVNPYYAEHGGAAYAGTLSKEQEQKLIDLLTPAKGAPVDVAIIGGRSNSTRDQYDNFVRQKELWHPGTLTPAVQQAMVTYVQGGGKLIFLAEIFRPDRVTEKYTFTWTGGPLDAILPKEPLAGSLPFMDGRDRAQWGTVSYRATGKGKVIIVEPHTPAPTAKEMTRQEFTLWGPLIRWMAEGDAAFPVTLAAALPARTVNAGAPLAATLTVKNYAAAGPLRVKAIAATLDGTVKAVRELPATPPRGQQQEIPLALPTDNTWLTGNYTLTLQAFQGKATTPAAELREAFSTTGILDLAVTSEQDGYTEAGTPVPVTVEITNHQQRAYPSVVVHAEFRDIHGRVLQQKNLPVNLAASPGHLAKFAFTMKDYPSGVYWVDVAVKKGTAVWAHADWPVYRYGPAGNDELLWTMWTDDHAPEWLRLFKDTGLNAITNDFRAAERWDFKVWTRNQYGQRLTEKLPDAEITAGFAKLYAQPLPGRRDPAVWHPLLTQVCEDGENGWPLLLRGKAQQAPFIAWLKTQYPSLEALNAEWGKAYTSWEEVEYHEPNSGYGVFAPAGVKDPIAWNDQQAWISEQAFRYHQFWSQALRETTPYGVKTAATACAWSHDAGADLLDLQCAQPWISTTDFFWQATKGRPLFGTAHARSTHWAFVGNRPVLSTAFWGAIAAGSRTIDMWTPVYPEKTRYPSWDGTFNIYQPSAKHSPASLDIKALIAQISRKQQVLMDAYNVPSREVAYYEVSRGAAAEFGLFGHLFHAGYLPNLLSGPEADLAKYKVILATGVNGIDTATARKLQDYVAGGGLLLTFPGFATADRHGKAYDTAPALGLDAVVGLKFAGVKTPEGEITITGTHPALALPAGTTLAVWADKSVQGAIGDRAAETQVLAQYAGGQPALTLHPYGKGYAVHVNFGVQCGPSYAGQNRFVWRDPSWEELRRLLEGLLRWGKAERPFAVLDANGHGIPHLNAAQLATADGSVNYLVAYSDYRQEHSQALELATANGAAQKIAIPATNLTILQQTSLTDSMLTLTGKEAFAEGTFTVPAAGRYQVWLQVNFPKSSEPNALAITIDGQNAPPDNASGPERLLFGNTPIADQWLWQSGRWFDLSKGAHTIRLTALGAPVQLKAVLLITPPALGARVYFTNAPKQVYDVYAGTPVPLKRDTRGAYLPLTLQPGEGKIFSLLPYTAGKPSLAIDLPVILPGEMINVTAVNPAPGTHAMRLTVTANGQEIRPLRREFSLKGKTTLPLYTALNDPKGSWTVMLEDETTGMTTKSTVVVK